jgi:hypothetical protein
VVEDTAAEEMDAETEIAENAPVAPRPSATAGPAVRVAEDDDAMADDGIEMFPTASSVPPPTAAVGATVVPLEVTDLYSDAADTQPNYLRWAQIVIGLATALLLGATIYTRRQSRQ